MSVDNDRKRVRRDVRRPISESDVLIKDRHEDYISWEEFEHNQRVIADNAMSKGSGIVKARCESARCLSAGLVSCGHCARKLHVHYSSNIGRYTCYGARSNHGTKRCISIGSLKIDAAVSKEILRIVKPLGVDAAVKAIEAQSQGKQLHSASTSWPCSKRAMRLVTPAGNTMPSIRKIVLSPGSLSGAGLKPYRGLSERWRPAQRRRRDALDIAERIDV